MTRQTEDEERQATYLNSRYTFPQGQGRLIAWSHTHECFTAAVLHPKGCGKPATCGILQRTCVPDCVECVKINNNAARYPSESMKTAELKFIHYIETGCIANLQ